MWLNVVSCDLLWVYQTSSDLTWPDVMNRDRMWYLPSFRWVSEGDSLIHLLVPESWWWTGEWCSGSRRPRAPGRCCTRGRGRTGSGSGERPCCWLRTPGRGRGSGSSCRSPGDRTRTRSQGQRGRAGGWWARRVARSVPSSQESFHIRLAWLAAKSWGLFSSFDVSKQLFDSANQTSHIPQEVKSGGKEARCASTHEAHCWRLSHTSHLNVPSFQLFTPFIVRLLSLFISIHQPFNPVNISFLLSHRPSI